jgi:hypothetical protein
MCRNFSRRINLIHENKIDKDFFGTEEFSDIFIKAFENSIKTRNREKGSD